MQRACSNGELGHVSDMAIVDTFTKLIFGEDDAYSAKELLIIKALRAVDANVALDSHRDMGQYLRALGVREMIQMVARVQQQLVEDLLAVKGSAAALVEGAHYEAMNRRAH